jgi:hypothetical protein
MIPLQEHNDEANDIPFKDRAIRVIAIIIAFIGVFIFFFKILFF